MKISGLLHGYNPDLEERKRSVQRKEVGNVYKKHAKYADASKNPMLQALENLLSGKTEKDLHEADAAARKDAQPTATEAKEEQLARPEVKKEISQLKQSEQEVIAHENAHKSAGAGVTGAVTYTHTTGPDDQRFINGGEVPFKCQRPLESRMKRLRYWKGYVKYFSTSRALFARLTCRGKCFSANSTSTSR